MLVSQVLADFVGQIKANINTEVQMKTRDEGDLKRIETKYGTSYVQELVKSPVGSGMVQNSSWNRGRPYYVTFRPILHSVVRLGDDELEKYNKYNDMVDDLSYQLDQLEEIGKDVFDLRLELKLSLDKIKAGSFNMVEIYVEGLKPRIDKIWKELGKTPKKFERELVSATEIQESISAAQKESEKAKTAESAAGAGGGEKAKKLTVNDDVPPDKILNLCNGMLVIKLNALVDEIKSMKEADFQKHINPDKNDFADWIRDAYQNDKWADIADTILTKADYENFLTLLGQGKEKEFKVSTPRPKPYSSKNKGAQPAAAPAQAQPAAQTTAQPAAAKPAQPVAQAPAQKPAASQQPQTQPKPTPAQPAAKPAQPVAQAPAQKPAAPAQQQPAAKQPQPQPKPAPAQPAQPTQPNWQEINKYLQGKQQQEKITYLKDQLNKFPGDENILFTLAAAYHRINDLVNAELHYKKILDKNPENPKVLYYIGSVYNAQKKYNEALEVYKKVIQLQPDYPKVKEYIDSINKILAQPKVQ
jgi:tetratricopeptide (TPR) repeat protein